MNRFLLLVVVVIGTTWPQVAEAAVISRDWKTPGDGLLTYDDVNKREWLDLTQSRLTMFPGSTIEQKYQNGLLQLTIGGLFQGFTAASRSDVIELANSAIINTNTFDYATNEPSTSDLIGLAGPSIFSAVGGVSSFGLINEISVPPQAPANRQILAELFVNPDSGPNGVAGLIIYAGTFDRVSNFSNTGMWLFRVVPEPSASLLAVIGMGAAFIGFKRRKMRKSGHAALRPRAKLVFERLEDRRVLSEEKGTGPYI